MVSLDRLFGLAAESAEEAQRAAQQCLKLWDRVRDPVLQHPVARRCLQPGGPYRALVGRLARGDDMGQLPDLQRFVMKWRFASIIERSIEAKHSIAKRRLSHNSRPTPSSVSLALRMKEIAKLLQIGGTRGGEVFVNSLADRFSDLKRNLLELIGRFGLADNPHLCRRLETHNALRRKDVALAFYHCDLPTTFEEHFAAKKDIAKRRDAKRKALAKEAAAIDDGGAAAFPPTSEWGHQSFRHHAQLHFQEVAGKLSEDAVYSFSHPTEGGVRFFSVVDARPKRKQLLQEESHNQLDSSALAVSEHRCEGLDVHRGRARVSVVGMRSAGGESLGARAWTLPDDLQDRRGWGLVATPRGPHKLVPSRSPNRFSSQG